MAPIPQFLKKGHYPILFKIKSDFNHLKLTEKSHLTGKVLIKLFIITNT